MREELIPQHTGGDYWVLRVLAFQPLESVIGRLIDDGVLLDPASLPIWCFHFQKPAFAIEDLQLLTVADRSDFARDSPYPIPPPPPPLLGLKQYRGTVTR